MLRQVLEEARQRLIRRHDPEEDVRRHAAGAGGKRPGCIVTLDAVTGPCRRTRIIANRFATVWTAVSSDPPTSDDREVTYIEFDDIEVEVSVWEGMSGWNANAVIDGRDYRAMGAATREDALTRLTSSIRFSTEATFALGIKNRRYWSPNPYWKGR